MKPKGADLEPFRSLGNLSQKANAKAETMGVKITKKLKLAYSMECKFNKMYIEIMIFSKFTYLYNLFIRLSKNLGRDPKGEADSNMLSRKVVRSLETEIKAQSVNGEELSI